MLLGALDSNWISLGPHVESFEREMAAYVGVDSAAALSSGTAALHLALLLCDVGPGDIVATSTLTFAATANAIRYCGAQPLFIDADPATWTMDVTRLEDALLRREANADKLPKVVMPVDIYGQSADYDRIVEVCRPRGIRIVEDAAEALGSTYKDKRCGALGDIGVFSFNGNKIITTASGGMLLSDDTELVARARFMSAQARDPAPHYQHSVVGYNYRLSNLLAALGSAQLEVLDSRVARRRQIFALYREALGDLPGVALMPEASYGACNRWLTCITIDAELLGVTREEVRLHLEKHEVESCPVWKPMHLQPVFAGCSCHGGNVASQIFETGLCLPSGSSLGDDAVDRICTLIRRFAGIP